ncbi:hypothetical protein, partial [Prosthecobacter sp.]|uniref:hypothetical protein n=1 Tax=Prosthecobacter sp. TaxID=1965333 RepID=UPI0025EF9532
IRYPTREYNFFLSPFEVLKHCLALFILAVLVFDFLPSFGPPFFRYTGSDPKHLVWNLGWPIPWIIYDSVNPPHWFAWLGGRIAILFVTQVILIMACALLPWILKNNDKH